MSWNARHAWSVGEILTAANHNNNDANLDLVVSTRWRKTTAKTVNTTVSATDLLNGEFTISANTLGTAGVLRFRAEGDWKQNSGATTAFPRLQFVFGATTVLDTGAGPSQAANSTSRFGWWVEIILRDLGAANSQSAYLRCGFTSAATGTGASAAFTTGEGAYQVPAVSAAGQEATASGWNSAAVDTTASAAFVLNVINPSASASVETKLYGATIEVV